jgi:hypothetical protein
MTISIFHRATRRILNAVINLGEWFTGDARHYQIFFLTLFLLFGFLALQWDLNAANLVAALFTCLITQAVFTLFTTQDYRSLKSALISAMSLSLLLRTDDARIMMLASFLSIASKFIFRTTVYDHKGLRTGYKHFFNPTNFGIIVTMVTTGRAWISPGQWGSSGLLLFMIGLLGLLVLVRAHRLDTAVSFLITFAGLNYLRTVIVLGWKPDHFLHQLTSGTLLLFAFFMITDPVSTPSHPRARMVWASLIGALAFYLGNYGFVNGAPLWALFFLSPFTLLLDRIFTYRKFSWTEREPPEPTMPTAARASISNLFHHHKQQTS